MNFRYSNTINIKQLRKIVLDCFAKIEYELEQGTDKHQKALLQRDKFGFSGERGIAFGDPLWEWLQTMNVRSLRSLSFSFFRLAQASLTRLQNKNARYRGTFILFGGERGIRTFDNYF